MGVPPGISFIFYQIQGLPQFQLPLAMLWKRETTRIWGKKFDRKTFAIICEVKLNGNWWHCSSTTRYRVPFLKGIAKGANLTPCQTNQLYTGKASTPVYVSGFITAVQMIRNVFSERAFMVQVLPGVCTDQIHHTLSWHLKEKTTAMWGMKLDTK